MEHSELFKEIRKIEIVTRNLVNDHLAGQYHSVFKGRGMAFDEVRQYNPGDDVRLIDWNVSARMNEPYVKIFVEEREMTVMLLVDVSGSGSFGTVHQTKAKLTAKLAAIFAFSAIKNNDRVGLIMFSDQVELFVPPKKGKKHVLRVVSEILRGGPGKNRGTDISCALDYFGHITKKRSVGIIISDFLDENYERSLKLANKRHDLIPICLWDPAENSLPPMGLIYMEDSETGEIISVDTDSLSVREGFEHMAKEIKMKREHLFRRHRIDFANVSTADSDMSALVNFFRRRARRALR